MTTLPVNTKNLRSILERIWSGELEHDQKNYFCGTSCCVAGWDVALNAKEQPENPGYREDWYTFEETDAYSDPWAWSRDHNRLTDAEARLIFNQYSNKVVQKALLVALEKGRRLEIPWELLVFENEDYGYLSETCTLYCPRYLEELKTFFEGCNTEIIDNYSLRLS